MAVYLSNLLIRLKFYVYKVARDVGFAPNPFGGYCTLATCKPKIRRNANVDDWVFGIGSKKSGNDGRIVYGLLITETLTYNEYWNDFRFQFKKPVLNGSLKSIKGDNIYYKGNEGWFQANSHHSNLDGTTNYVNLKKDTSADRVLISEHFYYFGSNSIPIPEDIFDEVYIKFQGEKLIKNSVASAKLVDYIKQYPKNQLIGLPTSFYSTDKFKG